MNIENIHSLAAILNRIGVDGNIAKELLQYICFLPSEFTLVKQVAKEKDLVTSSFRFVRIKEEYVCSYYEVSLLKVIEVPDKIIESIHVKDLDKRMAAIDWNVEDESNNFNLQEETTWKREREIEKVVEDLLKLSSSEEGKYFAEALKVKYWSCSMGNPLFGNVNSLRAKFEISQKFYLIEGNLISIEEAYRFLMNRWMEKQQQLNKKQAADPGKGRSLTEGAGPVRERSLLPKIIRKRKLKS